LEILLIDSNSCKLSLDMGSNVDHHCAGWRSRVTLKVDGKWWCLCI